MQNLFRLENVFHAMGKNNQMYISGSLSRFDKRIDFKLFGAKPQDIETLLNNTCIELIQFEKSRFNDMDQFVIRTYRVLSQEEITGNGLIPESSLTEEELDIKFNKIVNTLSQPYQDLVHKMKTRKGGIHFNLFKKLPAAKSMHHAYQRGLIEHSLAVTEFCINALELVKDVNRDVLVFSALFHDFGKVFEFNTNRYDLVENYSLEGNLISHLVSGPAYISEILNEVNLPKYEKTNILHCLLSHHGKLEWGSPVEPKTIEALILHTFDYFEATINKIVKGCKESTDTFIKLSGANTSSFINYHHIPEEK